jgi:two-component system phosphate regulon sensor histidine kinase PhoR
VRNSDFISIVKKAQKTRENFSDEFEMNGINYLLSANYIQAKDEIVVILYNTSQIKKLEQIKKDIVQNVSHELRTPLTAIKGFIETLEDEIDENKKYYLEIIKRHTDRLINIVQDLLLLSKLEENQASLLLADVDLKTLVDNVLVLFSQRLKEKRLYLNVHIDEDITQLKGDPFKLEQMLINIIDNAFKYTDEGGISINISRDSGLVRFEIRDTGIGIPKEHLERIFERFYTVDKSRSRKLGGTGLGLSIVKHIVLLHKGSIKIESQPGKGTKFIISIPANVTDRIMR